MCGPACPTSSEAGLPLRSRGTLRVVSPNVLESFPQRVFYPRLTTSPSSCNPTRIAHTYLGSTTTAFPNAIRSGGRCSCIQAKAAGETGRRRNTEPWFSQRKSTVGELPEATNESLCEDIIPPVKRREDAFESHGKD